MLTTSKILSFTSFAFAFAFPALANAQDTELCGKWGLFAETVMEQRQDGVRMTTVMGNAEANLIPLAPESADLIKSIVVSAYDKPRMSAEKNKRTYVEDFRNEIELLCFKGMQ